MKISVIAKQSFTALGRYRKIILVIGLSLALVWASSRSIFGDGPLLLGDPPVAGESVGTEAPAHPPPLLAAQTLSVNTADREAVRTFYNSTYSVSATMNWTGDYGLCNEGTTSLAFRDAVLQRINFFRAMAGVPAGITFSADFNSKAQKAALMMSVNDALDHSPPPIWSCYSADGATGAGKSNLFLGINGWEAISGYIRDPGVNNFGLGHRRWILYPKTQQMGSGDIPAGSGFDPANALYVLDGTGGARPATREEYVAWPPPGYVPYQVVYPRWSFALDGADFSAATVTLSSGGATLPITNLGSHTQNYGENTLGWQIDGMGDWDDWANPGPDRPYTVTINGVKVGSETRNFSYEVIIIDPARPSYNLTLSKSASAAMVGAGQTLTYTLVAQNDSPVAVVTKVMITDTVPASTTYVTGSASDEGVATGPVSGSMILWDTGLSLAPNEALTRTFQVKVSPGLRPGLAIANTGYISATEIAGVSNTWTTTIIDLPTVYLPLIIKAN